MALDDTSDPSHFFRDHDLIHSLRKEGSELSIHAADRLAWLRENMIDPAEYMRVSNERGRLFQELYPDKGKDTV